MCSLSAIHLIPQNNNNQLYTTFVAIVYPNKAPSNPSDNKPVKT